MSVNDLMDHGSPVKVQIRNIIGNAASLPQGFLFFRVPLNLEMYEGRFTPDSNWRAPCASDSRATIAEDSSFAC